MMSDVGEFGLNNLFDSGQIRLSALSLFNWGSFNGLHTATIDPDGTLITGDNGAGKSTLIDGLMALLQPAGRASFNVAAAQGDRSDRTLISYMRGHFGSVHDGGSTRVKSKREGPVVTGLRALYHGDDGNDITLAAMFWITQSTNALSDVKRIYVVAKRNLQLKEMLDAFGDGNIRSLKQWLKNDPAITHCDDNFSEYQALYRRLLSMDNKNAPALLSRALGLKKIDDLTHLIRALVLEPSTVKEDARKIVDEFTDLVAIHEQLVDAREQQQHLSRLPELQQAINQAENIISDLTAERESLPVYFAERCSRLWQEKIIQCQAELQTLVLSIKQSVEKETETKLLVEQRHEDYIKAGGGRIEALRKEHITANNELNRVITRSSRYQKNAQALGLNHQLQETRFLANQALVNEKLTQIKEENRHQQDKFALVSAEYSNIQSEKKTIIEEITEIKARPDSNIDSQFQRLRDELLESLNFASDHCMFIAELIDVEESQRHWQGAIERALGGLRTTLLVPENAFSMVTRWLNSRHTGVHVRVQVVREINSKQPIKFKTDGFLKKLVWRPHPYRQWLKGHLASFDLHCVDSTEILDQTPFSMTQQGLIQMNQGRFEKKDQQRIDNRRYWYLGFSNQSRLAILKTDLRTLEERQQETQQSVEKARQAMDAIREQESLWKKLDEFQWDEINAPYWQNKVTQLADDIQVLTQAGSNLEKARLRWQDAKQTLDTVTAEKENNLKKEGELGKTLQDWQYQHAEASAVADEGLTDSVRKRLKQRVGLLTSSALDHTISLQSKHHKKIEQQLDTQRNHKTSAEKSAIGIMSSFRSHDKWQLIATDWGCDIASLDEYREHLRQLEQEGLPQLVEQFVQRLNKHATQSLARIRQRLDSERDDIVERIDTINQVLARTEFRSGSYLKLGAKTEHYPHVQAFNRQVSKVLSQATSSDHESRFQQLQQVVTLLDKASQPAKSNTLESMRLLDPRYQMAFYAEELDSQSDQVLDVLESSSGKSGGEKESFAGTIVAASLAYVLTPDGYDRPVYSTVFLDEAFSNTAEAVSRRVLSVFKALHIHVNLITPYKNLNLARESARSILIAERDPETHESHLCEVTWQEVDQQRQALARQTMNSTAQALGIELEV